MRPGSSITQANELLSLKPTLAKKLNDKIKSLQAEIEVLRSDTKVNELERKIQVLLCRRISKHEVSHESDKLFPKHRLAQFLRAPSRGWRLSSSRAMPPRILL